MNLFILNPYDFLFLLSFQILLAVGAENTLRKSQALALFICHLFKHYSMHSLNGAKSQAPWKVEIQCAVTADLILRLLYLKRLCTKFK